MTEIHQKGRYGRYIPVFLTLVDYVMLNAAFLLTYFLSPELTMSRGRTVWLLANLTYLPVSYWLRSTHQLRTLHMNQVVTNSLKAVGSHACLFITSIYFVGLDNIKWWIFLEFYGILFVLFPFSWAISRMLLKQYRRRGRNFSRVIIIGANSISLRLYNEMVSDAGFGYKFMGFFTDDKPVDGIPVDLIRGTLDDVNAFVAENAVDEIYFTLSGANDGIMNRMISTADANTCQFNYVPQLNRYVNRRFDLYAIGSMPILGVRHNPLKSLANQFLKRTFDILFSSAFLIVSPLIFIPVAIAIKMSSPGPVFFRQKRTGYRGRDFMCLKFRTMRVNADADKIQATQNDPRKTRVGDFLRRTSIDELPQFINVFLGDMSVVGPRPHMLKHTEEYSRIIDKYMVRHIVKPGITGWAQINGYRGQTEKLWQMEKRVEFDVWYIENWSFMLDVKIILRTVINALQGEKNAF